MAAIYLFDVERTFAIFTHSMVDLRPFEKLHAIMLIKEIVRSWWAAELAFADARGYVLDHAQGKIVPPGNNYCRRVLFSKEGFKHCNESLKEVVAKLKQGGRSGRAALNRCYLGFDIVAAPIMLDGELQGMLFVCGSLGTEPSSEECDELSKRVAAFAPEAPTNGHSAPKKIPILGRAELDHIRHLLELGAGEISKYHAELKLRERELVTVSRQVGERYRFENILGSSRSMQQIFQMLEKIVESDSTVLVNGESGTGKELVARAIHYNGPRAKNPFVVQNCSAFNDNLLESALFGHAKGSFTGAVKDKKGLFEVANGGTFFLDEIGDMSPALQVKLLRVLQEGTFTPVGATDIKSVDVRVIAATHKDLQKAVAQGQFREDLYYRINVIRIVVPPLRERMDDIPLLAEHFVRKHFRGKGKVPKLSQEAWGAFQRYAWPGNIRELENEIERLLVLGSGLEELPGDLLSPRIRDESAAPARVLRVAPPVAGSLKDAVEAVERDMIQQGLIRTHWNKSQLAKELGISRSNLIQKCTLYGLDRKE